MGARPSERRASGNPVIRAASTCVIDNTEGAGYVCGTRFFQARELMNAISTLLLVAVLVAAFERPAHAYLDPGSGSMLMQVLLGGVAGVAVIVKLYWRGLLSFLRIRPRDDR